ncbi:MAG: TonB-dependent receptor [Caulobacterales bacterium]
MLLKRELIKATLLAGTSFCLAAPAAVAQAPGDSPPTAQNEGINDIVVTAQRREQQLQEVPLAVTALNAAMIEDLNARDLRDLTGLVPNLVLSEVSIGPGMSQVSLRGVNSQDPEKSFDPAVGVFIDGVYLGTSAFNLLDAFDLQQVEVLRGPQGTLFGRNTTGGAINAFRTLPTGEFGIRASAVLGTDDRRDFQTVINFPIGDSIGVKLSGFQFRDDGLWDNPAGGATGAEDRRGFSVRVLVEPTNTLSFDIIYDAAHDESQLTPYIPRGVGIVTPLPYRITQTTFPTAATVVPGSSADRYCLLAGGACAQTDFSFSRSTDPHRMNADMHALTFTAAWQPSDALDVTFIAGHRSSDEEVYIDFDGTSRTVFNVVRNQDFEQVSAELRVATNFDGPINFVAGAFHFHSEYNLQQAIKLDLAMAAPLPALGLAFTAGGGDEDEHQATTNALFAQADWALSEQLTLTLGGRASWDEKQVYTRFVNAPPGFNAAAYSIAQGIPANRPITSQGGASEDWFEFTPRVAMNYKWSDDLLLYASYTRGYNAGGFSARAGTVADVTTPFDPEYINAYEVGFKSDLMGGRARFNAAFFYNDYEDKQEEAIQPGPPPTFTSTTVRNVSGARIMGLELEGSMIVSDVFRLDGSFGWMDAEYTEYNTFVGSAQYVSTPPQPAGTLIRADLSGLTLRRVPEFTASLTPTFETPFANGFLTARTTVRYVDEQYAEFFNDPRGLIPAQTFVDASVTYEFGGANHDSARITLFGENLTENQEVSSYTNSLVDFGTAAAPLTWGVELQVKY